MNKETWGEKNKRLNEQVEKVKQNLKQKMEQFRKNYEERKTKEINMELIECQSCFKKLPTDKVYPIDNLLLCKSCIDKEISEVLQEESLPAEITVGSAVWPSKETVALKKELSTLQYWIEDYDKKVRYWKSKKQYWERRYDRIMKNLYKPDMTIEKLKTVATRGIVFG